MSYDTELAYKNIKTLVEGNFFSKLYKSEMSSETLNELMNNPEANYSTCENLASNIFNRILILGQIEYDTEKLKKLIIENKYVSSLELEYLSRTLPAIDDYYAENAKEKMLERLKHGLAVHFTTPKITNLMQESGSFSPTSGIFTSEELKLIKDAQIYQIENLPDDKYSEIDKYAKSLSLGFQISRGISMGARTNNYWMYHTPEALSFLYGGNAYLRNKEGAIKHITSCTDTLKEEERHKVTKLLSDAWDKFIGTDEKQAAVLIPRDALEYETVTYWNEIPPRVEEIRPYGNNSFEAVNCEEHTRYMKPIPASKLFFVHVPTIKELNQEISSDIPLVQKESTLELLATSSKSLEKTLSSFKEESKEIAKQLDLNRGKKNNDIDNERNNT